MFGEGGQEMSSARQLDLFRTAAPVVDDVSGTLTSVDEDTLALFAWHGINTWLEVVRRIVLGQADSFGMQARELAKNTETPKKIWLKGGDPSARMEAVRKWRASW